MEHNKVYFINGVDSVIVEPFVGKTRKVYPPKSYVKNIIEKFCAEKIDIHVEYVDDVDDVRSVLSDFGFGYESECVCSNTEMIEMMEKRYKIVPFEKNGNHNKYPAGGWYVEEMH